MSYVIDEPMVSSAQLSVTSLADQKKAEQHSAAVQGNLFWSATARMA